MRKRNALIGLAIVVVAGGWYAFRPERLFVNQTVNESLGSVSARADPTTAVTAAALTPLATGKFHSNAHDTKGVATVIDFGGGRRVLRLTDFATSNGPDVRIYLVAAADVQDNATVKSAGFVELGPMKGNIGDQNYEIPASVDLANCLGPGCRRRWQARCALRRPAGQSRDRAAGSRQRLARGRDTRSCRQARQASPGSGWR